MKYSRKPHARKCRTGSFPGRQTRQTGQAHGPGSWSFKHDNHYDEQGCFIGGARTAGRATWEKIKLDPNLTNTRPQLSDLTVRQESTRAPKENVACNSNTDALNRKKGKNSKSEP